MGRRWTQNPFLVFALGRCPPSCLPCVVANALGEWMTWHAESRTSSFSAVARLRSPFPSVARWAGDFPSLFLISETALDLQAVPRKHLFFSEDVRHIMREITDCLSYTLSFLSCDLPFLRGTTIMADVILPLSLCLPPTSSTQTD